MPKVYLDRLKERYGWTGGPYRALMEKIIAQNHESVTRAVSRVKVSELKKEAQKLSKKKKPAQLKVPELNEVLPKRSVFIRKGADQGKLLSDTLRTRLSKDLRGAVQEYLKEGTGAMQYSTGDRRGRMKPEMIDRFEKQIKKSFAGYTKIDPEIGVPRNIRAIAVTETRSAVDDIKYEFSRRLLEKNPGMKARKRWKHNTHLVTEPRPGHLELDGKVVDMDKPFRVKQYRQAGSKQSGKNKGRPKWVATGGVIDLMHPHDPKAPPEEVIACQCEVDYLFQVVE